jgi:3-oxoacyl-[acyl-carrier-protein] synthase II
MLGRKRVVITGVGVTSAAGCSAELFSNSIFSGNSLISDISHVSNVIKSGSFIEEKILDEYLKNHIDAKSIRRLDKFIKVGMCAAIEAVQSSKIDFQKYDPLRVACLVSSGIGGSRTLYDSSCGIVNEKSISPFTIPNSLINILAGQIAIQYSIHGANFSYVSACASSAHSIGEAYHMIASNRCDAVIAGGAEASINDIGVKGFHAMRVLSTKYNDQPTKSSRPLDKNRDGFVMADGAAVLIMESLESALERGATIYTEVVGYGASCDANHITAPDKDGTFSAMAVKQALSLANIQIKDIDYINLHGTSTEIGDVAEINALRSVANDSAVLNIAISSTKSLTGHMLGAAGALEAVVAVQSIVKNQIPGQINLDEVDEQAKDINIITKTINQTVNYVLSNSFGFGGTNASIVFKKFTA